MPPHPLARLAAVILATLAGLALCFACLRTAAAAPAAVPAMAPATAQTWFVKSTPSEGLAGYWKLDQVFDHKTFNSVLLTNQAVLSGGASITTTVPTTVTIPDLGALDLDGINGAVVVSDAAALDVAPTSFSVAAWVRRASTGAYHAIYDSGEETNKWWLFIADTSKSNRFGFGVRGITETYSTRSITDSNWHHLAVVVSGNSLSKLTFFVDGAASGVVSVSGILTPTGTKRIGVLKDTNTKLLAYFQGDIDEVRLYNRALSAVEVQRLAAGRGCVTTGNSWATAFNDLQCALDVAANGDQVWLAGGTYRPGTAREASFHLLADLSLLGGFTGTETSPAQRLAFNPDAPRTVLSGDDAGDDAGPGTFSNYADNACSVVTTGSNLLPGFAVSDTFDALAIVDGNARCASPQSSSGGGLADFSGRLLTFHNVVFQANQAQAQGGGLASLGSLNFNAVTFAHNLAQSGGALRVGSLQGPIGVSVAVTLTAATFSDNQATLEGGALQILTGTIPVQLSLTGSQFLRNQARAGGAVMAHSSLSVSSSQFVSNTAIGQGGALDVFGTLTMSGSLVQQNHVFDFTNTASDFQPVGGGVFVSGTASLANTQFFTNAAIVTSHLHNNLAGGGGLAVAGTLTLTSSTFQGNTAEHGGGVQTQGAATIQHSLFQANSAGSGGGVFADGDLNLRLSRLVHNTALESLTNGISQGGGVLLQNGGLGDQISNNLFQDNLALSSSVAIPAHGSALSVDGFTTSIGDNTIVDSNLNGAPAVSVTGTTGLFNNIITSHTVAIEALGGTTFVDYDLFNANTVTATGVVSDAGHSRVANPRFADPAHNDFRLRLNSPAVDAGDNEFVLAGITTDLNGGPRFADVPGVPDTGHGTPPIVDIGAFELGDELFLPLIQR